MNVLRFVLPVAGASLFFLASGCAGKEIPPSEPPRFTSAEVKPAPMPEPTIIASPNVSVSPDLAAACNLQLDNVESAPKFDFDRSQLGAEDNAVLSQIASCITTGPLAGRALDLVGRADPRGDRGYNMALGERRATSVRDQLSSLGVDGSKLSQSSRGELDAKGTDEIGWQRDRRVDIRLH